MIHGSLLAWLVLAASTEPVERPRTIYEQEIQPYEKHVVFWYNLRDKLPDIKPAEAGKDEKPSRARVKFHQSIMAGKKDDARPPQRIAMPAPAIELPRPLPLPNVLAVTAPRPMRRFVPPPPTQRQPEPAAPLLPDAPSLQTDGKATPLDLAAPAARPLRPFAAPADPRVETAPPAALALPEAPRLAAPTAGATLPLAAPVTGPRRAFAAPGSPPAPLPAPEPALPAAPALEAPTLPDASPTPGATATLAIVGLSPVNTPEIPPPPGSHEAGFSAGIKTKPAAGDDGTNESAAVTVPGLLTRGGVKDVQPTLIGALAPPTSRQSLLAALHASVPAPATRANGEPRAARVSSAPDPRLAGRYIYTLAIQMPNVTSYSGSWMVWFAEREPTPGAPPGDMHPPVAVRKVDPKYIQAAADERVEGTVRLAAVIRRTGRVESVELLRHLDARLDRSAQEALAKWEFEPARRDGAAVDVDAVFEIPFRLAPRPKR